MHMPQIGDDLVCRGISLTAFDRAEPGRAGYREHYAHNENNDNQFDQSKAVLIFPGPLPTHLSHSKRQLPECSEPFSASEFFRTLTADATVRDVLRWESPSLLPISVWQRSL